MGVPNSDEGTDTLVLYVFYNPSSVFTNTRKHSLEKLREKFTVFIELGSVLQIYVLWISQCLKGQINPHQNDQG